jgi:hypothetical protein
MYRKAFGGNSPAGRDCFEDIVDRYGLKVRARVRKPRTTDSTHGLPVYLNIIQGKRTKLLTLRHGNDTSIPVGGERFSDRKKVFAQVVGHIVDRLIYLPE